MSKDDTLGIVILLSIITIALFGGAKGVTVNNNISKNNRLVLMGQVDWDIPMKN